MPPRKNHACPWEKPHMPPLGKTMHAPPPEQPHMPPRSNHACPPRNNHARPPVNRITDACENITFAGGKNELFLLNSSTFSFWCQENVNLFYGNSNTCLSIILLFILSTRVTILNSFSFLYTSSLWIHCSLPLSVKVEN